MSKHVLVLLCFAIAVILAAVAAFLPPYHTRLLALAVAFLSLGALIKEA